MGRHFALRKAGMTGRKQRRRAGGSVPAVALAAALALAPAAWPSVGHAAELEIRVGKISPRGGILRLGLYDAAGYPDDRDPVASADVPATPGGVVVILKNVPPGSYAIEAYQDINANDRMDSDWLGLPLEPYGFSRDARPFLSKPAFARVRFHLKAGHTIQHLNLQNSDAPDETAEKR